MIHPRNDTVPPGGCDFLNRKESRGHLGVFFPQLTLGGAWL